MVVGRTLAAAPHPCKPLEIRWTATYLSPPGILPRLAASLETGGKASRSWHARVISRLPSGTA